MDSPDARTRQHKLGIAAMVFCTVCWSLAGLLTRTANVANGWETNFWRSLFLCALIGALLAWEHRSNAFARIVAMGWPGVVSSLAWATMFTCFMLALSRTSVANALILMGVLPFCAAVTGRLFLGERVAARTWISMTVAGAGIAWMFHDAFGTGNLAGSLIALAVPLAAAVNTIAVKRGRGKVDLAPALLVGGALSVVIALPLAQPFTATGRDLAIFGALALFQLALPCLLLVRFVLQRLSAAEVGLLSLLEVVMGPLWVWLAFGEEPGHAVMVGGAAVLAALVVNEGLALAQERRAAST